jgi:hypothetical protein
MSPRIAICYWGLTRSTRLVHHTHKTYLRDVLTAAGIEYDIYLHTWDTIQPQSWSFIDPPQNIEEYKLLEPTSYRRDNQEEFLASINFTEYWNKERYNRLGHTHEWHPYLVRNMLCALESQRRLTNMMLETNKEYDYVMYVRPDVRINNAFPVETLSQLGPTDIIIPDNEHHDGYNDRFAVVHWAHCKPYGCRFDEIQDGRVANPTGRICAEPFVKYIIDKHYRKPIQTRFRFDIVRPTGSSFR